MHIIDEHLAVIAPTMGKGERVNAILQFLFFPGLLFTAAAGLLTSWFDRKLTARVQMRKGPPLLQPFYDVAKLMIKETCVPIGTPTWFFLSAPLIGLAGVIAGFDDSVPGDVEFRGRLFRVI